MVESWTCLHIELGIVKFLLNLLRWITQNKRIDIV